MKSTTLLVAGAAVAAAQKVADYFPECSIDCLADSVSAASDCTLDDAWCICVQATYEAITAHGTSCVMQECGADVAVGDVLPAAIPYCEAATASHEGGSSPTATPSTDTASDAPSATDDANDADDDDDSVGADEEDEDNVSARAAPALLGMFIVAAAATFPVWA